MIEPLVPVDLVVDHSVQVDFSGSAEALAKNLEMEFVRNRERYQFLKWGMQAFDTFKVVPPGIGIVHQVNLEYLAKGVLRGADGVWYPDTLVGTDSHTTMINGLGIVGWGVGGIEAEAGMLGQPVYFLTPDVVGRPHDGLAARGRHGDRPRAHGHAAAAEGQGRGQVRRVLRPGRGRAARSSTARRSPTCRPSTGPPWDSSRSTRSASSYLLATGRSRGARRRSTRPTTGRRASGECRRGARSTTRRTSSWTSARSSPASRARSARRTGSSFPGSRRSSSARSRRPLAENGFGKRPEDLRASPSDVSLNGTGQGEGGPRQRPYRRHHELHEHLESLGHAGRRAPREEGGGARPHGGARRSRPRSRRARAS